MPRPMFDGQRRPQAAILRAHHRPHLWHGNAMPLSESGGEGKAVWQERLLTFKPASNVASLSGNQNAIEMSVQADGWRWKAAGKRGRSASPALAIRVIPIRAIAGCWSCRAGAAATEALFDPTPASRRM